MNTVTELMSIAASVYKQTESVNETARQMGVSSQKVRKLLISGGIYPTDRCMLINAMLEANVPDKKICSTFYISKKVLNNYKPYTRGVYLADQSAKAIYQAKRRRRFKTGSKA